MQWSGRFRRISLLLVGLLTACTVVGSESTSDRVTEAEDTHLLGRFICPDLSTPVREIVSEGTKITILSGRPSPAPCAPMQRDATVFTAGASRSSCYYPRAVPPTSIRRRFAPELVLHVGDVIEDARYSIQWSREMFSYLKCLLTLAPVYPVMGNHEYHDPRFYRFFRPPIPDHEQDPERAFYSFGWEGPLTSSSWT